MNKRWINCAELFKYHDVQPAESVHAITNGKIEAYSDQLRKIVDARNYELKKNTRDVILSEIDIAEKNTGKRPLVTFSPDADHLGEFLGANAGKIIKNRWDNNIPTYYIVHPHGTFPISFYWLERILQNSSRKTQCEELSFIQFRYEDAVRCFGLAPAEDAPAPVDVGQDAPVVEGQEAITTFQDLKQQPGGPTQKELLAEAERLLALKDSDRLEGNDRRHVQAFVYRVKGLPLDRVYETLAVGFKDKASKNKGTRKGNYHAWARKGEKICRDRLS